MLSSLIIVLAMSSRRWQCLSILLAATEVSSFVLHHHSAPTFRTLAITSQIHSSRGRSLSYLLNNNDTVVVSSNDEDVASFIPPPPQIWNDTLAELQIEELEALEREDDNMVDIQKTAVEDKRSRLKRELAHAAITGFVPDDNSNNEDTIVVVEQPQSRIRIAEDIMKDLESSTPLPVLRPATHHSLNGEWSFVFTGVPTLGMRLITLLSRISVFLGGEKMLDFRNVALFVEDEQTKAKALVEVEVCGGAMDLVLEVCTSLRRPTEEELNDGEYKEFREEDGTLLLEHFQGIHLNGVEIPTPQSWHTTRTLEVSYMDKDILICRTSKGEPHLLLRNTPLCYRTPEEMMLNVEKDATVMMDEIEECDLDGDKNTWTEYFSDAIEIYGERITRCLVDRDFGKEEYTKKNQSEKRDDW